jgi:iron complex outermembrane receptor protein
MKKLNQIFLILVICSGYTEQIFAADLSQLSLEELMQQEVTGASNYVQKVSEAPADVSVITASDVRRYGWRNLADVLRSVRSFYLTNDRTYQYAGIRGVSPTGDLDNRILFMIDGVRVNDGLFDSTMMGETFPLDLDLVERIEIIRGPGSSIYGGNAMFGVINLITRSGRDLDGTEVGVGVASRQTYDGRVSAGHAEGNREWLLSATKANSGGGSYEFSDIKPGVTTSNQTDAENWQRVFGKMSIEDWHASFTYGNRQKYVPTGSYGTIFNDPSHHEDDTFFLTDVSKLNRINDKQDLYLRVFTGLYQYRALWPTDNTNLANSFGVPDGRPYVATNEYVMSQWQGMEGRWTAMIGANQHWITGVEYTHRYNYLEVSEAPSLSSSDYYPYTPTLGTSNHLGLYTQDEIKVNDKINFTIGVRHDQSSGIDNSLSPRLSLVFQADPANTYKVLYGTSFRNPDFFEHLNIPNNMELDPEEIQTLEGIWKHRLSSDMTLMVNVFRNDIYNAIQQDSNYFSYNASPILTQGSELEWEGRFDNDSQFRISYTYQTTHQDGLIPDNSPSSIYKANIGLPLAPNWTSGFEAQGMTSRLTNSGSLTVGSYAIANLTVGYHPSDNKWLVTGSVYNLFDHQYADPIQYDPYIQSYYGVTRSSLVQDGRLFRLKFETHF